jgi:hypothetical protein
MINDFDQGRRLVLLRVKGARVREEVFGAALL